MSFLWFLVGFLEKWVKSCKYEQVVGVLRRGIETLRRSEGPHHGVASHPAEWPSGEFGHPRVRRSVAELRRSVATIHNKENCCVLVLFFYFVAPRTHLLD